MNDETWSYSNLQYEQRRNTQLNYVFYRLFASGIAKNADEIARRERDGCYK